MCLHVPTLSPSLGTHRSLTSSNIALPKQPHLVLSERPDDRMQHPLIIKQHHVPFLPIVRIHEPRRDPRPLQPVHNLPDGLEIVDDVAVREVDLADGAGVDLQGQLARDGVLPRHGQDLDLCRVDGREVGGGEFAGLGVEAQTVGAGLGVAHPDVRMGRVLDPARSDEFFVRGGKDVVHPVPAYESRGAERDVQFVACAVVVAEGLAAAARDGDGEEGRHFWRVEIVERGVDVPAVEARVGEVVMGRDGVLVEFLVVRVHKGDVGEAFVLGNVAIADDLDFGLVGDGFEVWVQDAAFGVQSLAVAVAGGGGIKAVG